MAINSIDRIRSGFNFLAPFYDMLLFLSSGRLLRRARLTYIQRIKQCSNLLILGGGTGQFLIDVLDAGYTGHIHYLDLSPTMTLIAENKFKKYQNKEFHSVKFQCGCIHDLPDDKTFDGICCNFIFDLFIESSLLKLIHQLESHSNKQSQLFFCDFQNSIFKHPIWHKLSIKILYAFFRLICKIQAQTIPNYEKCLVTNAWYKENNTFYLQGMIEAAIYKIK